ncbi:MAG: ABC-F family ATP-binding cassette domain-containing protein [Planctomycetota bacterium]
MLKLLGIHKSYGQRELLAGVDLVMTPRERLGLVGRNGSGKTTLLRMIIGQEACDEGRIEISRNYRVGHLSQHLHFSAPTIRDEACLGLTPDEHGVIAEHKAEAMLAGLGFPARDLARPPQEISGGFQVRLQLAKLLLSEPNLLLLDEPTNFLDIVTVRWLRRWLRAWPGEMILVTHDQDFMDSVTTHTMMIHRSGTRRIAGPTTQLYELIAQEEEHHEKTRLNMARARKDTERFINRFRAQATRARAVQSRIKQLAKHEKLDELDALASLDFHFNEAPFSGEVLLGAEELAFTYSGRDKLLIEDFNIEVRRGDRIGIVGKNGQGKSTLLNLFATELTPTAGRVRRHQNLRPAHFGQMNIDRLDPKRTVEDEILSMHPDNDRRAARAICGAMMFPDQEALKTTNLLSGGERARVLLGKLLVTPANFLLLDEPTNHLDMDAIDALIQALAVFQNAIVFVTHNERMLSALATRLVVFDRDRVNVFEGTYDDFLSRIGWSNEATGDDSRSAARATETSRRDERRARAEWVTARARALRPIEERMKTLERDIAATEVQSQATQQALIAASTQGDGATIARCSRELHALTTRSEKLYEELARVSDEHDRAAEKFARE